VKSHLTFTDSRADLGVTPWSRHAKNILGRPSCFSLTGPRERAEKPSLSETTDARKRRRERPAGLLARARSRTTHSTEFRLFHVTTRARTERMRTCCVAERYREKRSGCFSVRIMWPMSSTADIFGRFLDATPISVRFASRLFRLSFSFSPYVNYEFIFSLLFISETGYDVQSDIAIINSVNEAVMCMKTAERNRDRCNKRVQRSKLIKVSEILSFVYTNVILNAECQKAEDKTNSYRFSLSRESSFIYEK